jgi:hypothetical protein
MNKGNSEKEKAKYNAAAERALRRAQAVSA